MAILDESQFEVLESMLVPLAEIKHVSEKLSADSKPTIHMCLIHLFNMTHLSRRYPETIPKVVPFLDCIAKGLEKRLPNFGREEPLVRTIFLHFFTTVIYEFNTFSTTHVCMYVCMYVCMHACI
jgi:hypothetical protein